MIGLMNNLITGCVTQSVLDSISTLSPQLEYPTDLPTVIFAPTTEPVSTIMPTIPVTLTPLPTLTTEQAQAKIRELFETNGGCQLPCWWGVTLGTSTSDVFYNFIQSIAMPNMYWRFSKNLSDDIEFYSDLPEDMEYLGESVLHGRIYADDGKVTQIYLEGFDWPSYYLSSFLLENGKPDEVWIATYGLHDQSLSVPFIVYLLYSEKGMMVSYGGSGEQHGEKIIGCVSVSPYLSIWVPEKKLSFVEAYALVGGDFSKDKFKSILDATEGKIDAERIYERYKDIKDVPCIETRADLWPIIR